MQGCERIEEKRNNFGAQLFKFPKRGTSEVTPEAF